MNKEKIAKRFLQILIILIGISFLSFLLIFLAPGGSCYFYVCKYRNDAFGRSSQ